MELKVEESKDSEKVEESIREIISSNKLLSMATTEDEEPHINTAFYAYDSELNLYLLTPPDTKHGKNLEQNSSVAVDIHDSHQEWTDKKKGLQIFGNAEKLENKSEILEKYSERFEDMKEVASDPKELEELDSVFYRIRPERIKVFDEPRFGTETWIIAKLK